MMNSQARRPTLRTVVTGILAAVLSVTASVSVRAWLDPVLGNEFFFSFVYLAIAFTVWSAGLWPAVLATAIGFVAADYLFLAPRYTLVSFSHPFDLIVLTTYLSTSATICLLGSSLRAREARLAVEIQHVRAQSDQLRVEATKREEAQRSLQKSEDLLRRVLETLPVGLWILNARGAIEHGNPAAQAIWRGARFVGPEQFGEYKGWWVKSGKQIAPDEWAAARAIKKGETSIDEEVEIECFDGTHKIILNSAIPIRNQDREITGAIIVNQDITSRKKNEQELEKARQQLQQYATELEERVAERTVHLEQTIRSLEGVLYHIAHDLRAPLRAMNGFSSILLESYARSLDDTGREFVSNIAQAALRMDRLIQDLLAYGQLGHMTVAVDRVELRALLEACLHDLEPEISRTHAHVDLDEHLPEVTASVTLLKSALTNLLSNAIKYVRPGGTPRVRVWAEKLPGKIRIFVEDNGIGIAKEYQEKIFRIFERVPSAEVEVAGTGIGLAIVKKALERMGGQVGVESEPGCGSRFWLELPDPKPHPVVEPETAVGEPPRLQRSMAPPIDEKSATPALCTAETANEGSWAV